MGRMVNGSETIRGLSSVDTVLYSTSNSIFCSIFDLRSSIDYIIDYLPVSTSLSIFYLPT